MAADTHNRSIDAQIAGHALAEATSMARLGAMSMAERSRLIEAACRAAAIVLRDRAAAGATPVQPVPWPQSTWEFLRRHAAGVRTESTH
jgi:hypothetical protein